MKAALTHVALYLLLKNALFVARGKTMLDISSFLLATENRYYAEGCWNFEPEVP
jgi:hypothetical protein